MSTHCSEEHAGECETYAHWEQSREQRIADPSEACLARGINPAFRAWLEMFGAYQPFYLYHGWLGGEFVGRQEIPGVPHVKDIKVPAPHGWIFPHGRLYEAYAIRKLHYYDAIVSYIGSLHLCRPLQESFTREDHCPVQHQAQRDRECVERPCMGLHRQQRLHEPHDA